MVYISPLANLTKLMSRTRISTKIMENNSNQLSLLSGINAYDFNDNASFQTFFDKSLDNKKQCNQYDANNFSGKSFFLF